MAGTEVLEKITGLGAKEKTTEPRRDYVECEGAKRNPLFRGIAICRCPKQCNLVKCVGRINYCGLMLYVERKRER